MKPRHAPPAFPEALDGDDDDVAWALSTGGVEWNRGAHDSALVWLRRAIDSAREHHRLNRARDLEFRARTLQVALEVGWVAVPPSSAPPTAPEPPRPPRETLESIDADSVLELDVEVEELADEADAPEEFTLVDELQEIEEIEPIETIAPAPAGSRRDSLIDVDDADIVQLPSHALSDAPSAPAQSAPPYASSELASEEPTQRESSPGFDLRAPAGSAPPSGSGYAIASAPPAETSVTLPAGSFIAPLSSIPPARSEPVRAPPSALPPSQAPASAAPPPSLPSEPAPLPSEPAPLPSEPAPLPSEPAPLPSEPAPLPSELPPLPSEPAPLPSEAPTMAGQRDAPRAPLDAPEIGGILLASVPGLQDLPEDAQAELVRGATIESLTAEEEISGFGLALVLEGTVAVMPNVADVAAVQVTRGQPVFSQGHLAEGVAVRVVAGAKGARVAAWSKGAYEAAVRDFPWVKDELQAVGDRFQALAGVCMGPLGENLDDLLRSLILERCELRYFLPGEILAEQGKPVSGMYVIGGGHVELVQTGAAAHAEPQLGPGDFLFPSQILQASAAPQTARAGAGGALALFAPRPVAHELMLSVPPLLEIFAR